MSGIEMVSEIPAVMEEATMADVPAEIYEPVQVLKLRCHTPKFYVEIEDGSQIYEVDELYCNVPIAGRMDKADSGTDGCWFECVGRLTISRGVAYVDVG